MVFFYNTNNNNNNIFRMAGWFCCCCCCYCFHGFLSVRARATRPTPSSPSVPSSFVCFIIIIIISFSYTFFFRCYFFLVTRCTAGDPLRRKLYEIKCGRWRPCTRGFPRRRCYTSRRVSEENKKKKKNRTNV